MTKNLSIHFDPYPISAAAEAKQVLRLSAADLEYPSRSLKWCSSTLRRAAAVGCSEVQLQLSMAERKVAWDLSVTMNSSLLSVRLGLSTRQFLGIDPLHSLLKA